jgi:hypothetical protein
MSTIGYQLYLPHFPPRLSARRIGRQSDDLTGFNTYTYQRCYCTAFQGSRSQHQRLVAQLSRLVSWSRRLISAGTVVGVQKLDGNEAQSSFSWTCVEDCGIDVEEEDEDSGGHPDTDLSWKKCVHHIEVCIWWNELHNLPSLTDVNNKIDECLEDLKTQLDIQGMSTSTPIEAREEIANRLQLPLLLHSVQPHTRTSLTQVPMGDVRNCCTPCEFRYASGLSGCCGKLCKRPCDHEAWCDCGSHEDWDGASASSTATQSREGLLQATGSTNLGQGLAYKRRPP